MHSGFKVLNFLKIFLNVLLFLNIFLTNVIMGNEIQQVQSINQEISIPDIIKQDVVFYAQKECGSNEFIARDGKLIKRKGAPATVVILHGYGMNQFAVGPMRIFFPNYNTMTFNFRAHGENSEHQCSTVGYDEIFDVFAAINFVKSQPDLKDKPIYIFAQSMGASTAIEAQAIYPGLCQAMFLDTPFASSKDVIHASIEKMKVGLFGYEFSIPGIQLLEKYAFNQYVQYFIKFLLKNVANMDMACIDTFMKPIYPVDSIKNISIPCFFVVCKNDGKISVNDVRKIFNNHNGTKRLWITDGRCHCDSVFCDPEKYFEVANGFFNDVYSNKINSQPKQIIFVDDDNDSCVSVNNINK